MARRSGRECPFLIAYVELWFSWIRLGLGSGGETRKSSESYARKVRTMARHALYLIVLCIPLGAATCDSLASLKLAKTTITAAKVVASGEFRPPGMALGAEAL